MQTLQGPEVLEQPFCASGDKNTIPSAATGSQLASLAEGFPEITQKPIEEGGIPPEREDFNGALNLMSQFYYAFQNGWLPTFDEDVSEAIGGYAEGAVLWYAPTTGTYANKVIPLRSTISNNTYNFNLNSSYIGTYWVVSDPASNLPPHVFTSDNVIGGQDIEINRIIDPYVLNEDTLACFHLNGDTNNAVDTGVTLSDAFKAAITGYTDPLVNPWYPGKSAAVWAAANNVRNVPLFSEDFDIFGTLNDYTLEFFVTGNNNIVIDIKATDSTHANNVYPRITPKYGGWNPEYYIQCAASSSVIDSSAAFSFGTYTHVAMVRKNQVASIYVNGTLVSTAANSLNFANFLVNPQYDSQSFTLAEIVFSKIAKWDGNFTPPTAPYHPQEGGNQYEIKSTAISNHTTNCLTEVPQNINLTLSSGTLTLKAGSKLYVPNGSGVFDELTISSDLTTTETTDNPYLLFTSGTAISKRAITSCFSGSSAPTLTDITYAAWYDTSNNLVKLTSDGGSTWDSGFCLPFGAITVSSGAIKSIDKIFNGFGYIGSTVFALPGIKGLIPNGYNADGTLNNEYFETTTILTINGGYNSSNEYYSLTESSLVVSKYYVSRNDKPSTTGTLWYRPLENKMYRVQNDSSVVSSNSCLCIQTSRDPSGKIESFNASGVIIVNHNEKAQIIETYHNGTSWYRVWSDGWCEQGGDLELGTTAYTFQKAYASAPKVFIQKYTTNVQNMTNAGGATLVAAPTTTGFSCYSDGVSATYWAGGYWEAKGYIF